jgi:hypothetical protein
MEKSKYYKHGKQSESLFRQVGVDRPGGKIHNLFASCIKHCIYDGIVNWYSIPVSCKYLKKPLIVGSLYRPPGINQKYAEDLCGTISSLSAMFRRQ